ncbi:MAG: YggS family pyridoxal phosphate-dependent enzyme [Bacilli bacterium]|nr:YggS family pyridoxal phosphate-dependent enzyme [Bacilli bacterium]
MKIRKDIKDFVSSLPSNITLVAATKYINSSLMKELYFNGINNFGENRVDAFLEKYESLKQLDIKWHFIGHLQRNKAKSIINKIDYLHSLDSLELAKIIQDKREKPLPTFIEVSINEEESKNGVKLNELDDFFTSIKKYDKIKIIGLMMMSRKYSDKDALIRQFKKLKETQNYLQSKYKVDIPYLSMGMSDDYKEALSVGATHIRLGRILFIED